MARLKMKDYDIQIKWGYIDIDLLDKAKWNYKEDDEEKQKKLTNQIKKNGQLENIIIRSKGKRFEIVNGNHRLDTFKELGYKKAMCSNIGSVPLEVAKRVAIETNETSFKEDDIKLIELMKEILDKFDLEELKSTMPFNDDELDNFDKITDFDWSKFDKPESEENYDNLITIKFEVEEEINNRFNSIKNTTGYSQKEIFLHMLEGMEEKVNG